MLKAFGGLSFRALKRFINYIFQVMKVLLTPPSDSNLCKRAQTAEINYRLPTVTHLVIDVAGPKVFGKANGNSVTTPVILVVRLAILPKFILMDAV